MKAWLYDWGGLNVWLFHTINDIHGRWIDAVMLTGTQLAEHGNFALYLGLIVMCGLWSNRRHSQPSTWLSVIAVFVLGYLADGWLVGMLKGWFAFPRPPLALPPGSVHIVGSPEFNLQRSLPSGHTSFAMLVSASLWPVLNRYGRIAGAGFVVWVAFSRISLGAHFPADVATGALSCLLVVWLVRQAIEAMLRPRS